MVPTQQQLIMQQPNGPIWIRVCADQNIVPTLQHVHQYDAALKLVTDNGHQASEEIYSCIVSEQNRHLQEQIQYAHRMRALAMARIAPATNFGDRAYMVRSSKPLIL
jgi:hypothetical protein